MSNEEFEAACRARAQHWASQADSGPVDIMSLLSVGIALALAAGQGIPLIVASVVSMAMDMDKQ